MFDSVMFTILGQDKLDDSDVTPRASLVAQWYRTSLPCRRHRFDPWSGKIPLAVGQLGHRSQLVKPEHPRAGAPQ